MIENEFSMNFSAFTETCEKPTPLGVGWIAGKKNLSSIAI